MEMNLYLWDVCDIVKITYKKHELWFSYKPDKIYNHLSNHVCNREVEYCII